jgi:hypothetical protein
MAVAPQVPSRSLTQNRATHKFCNRDQNLRIRSGYVPPLTQLSMPPELIHRKVENDEIELFPDRQVADLKYRLDLSDADHSANLVLNPMI